MKRDTRTAWRARQKATEASVDAAVAAVKAEQDAAWATAREEVRTADPAIPTDEALTARSRVIVASWNSDGGAA